MVQAQLAEARSTQASAQLQNESSASLLGRLQSAESQLQVRLWQIMCNIH